MKPPTITYLANIYFGAGMLDSLGELLQDLGIKRPLVVTDRGVVALGFVTRAGLDAAEVFADIETNPSERSVLAGLERYRAKGCDGLVALGGGSPMDCAKGIALLVNHPGPLEPYAFIHGGMTKISREFPPLVAVPTTAGTGSEVGRAALITLESGAKLGLLSPKFIPKTVICDPTLTLGTPPALTAGAGMDAISHCVETYCSPRFNPITEAIALDGLQRAWANLRQVVRVGSDLAARSEMMMAALQGGMSFQKGLGLIHSLSHPLGGLKAKRLHHGTLNGIFLPHVLRFNREACAGKMDRMAAVLGLGSGDELPGYFEAMTADLGLPAKLADMGLVWADLEGLAPLALRDHSSATNPRPVTEAICAEMYRAAL